MSDEEGTEFEFKGLKLKIDWCGFTLVCKDSKEKAYLDYESILELLHPEIEWFTDREDDYQGQWFAVGVDKNGKWYFHQGEFGSCSGCDWFESIETVEEAKELLDFLDGIICITETEIPVLEYLENEKQNLSWDEARETLDNLIKEVKKKLSIL